MDLDHFYSSTQEHAVFLPGFSLSKDPRTYWQSPSSQAMELRKRVKLNKLEHNLNLSPDAPAEGRCSYNLMWGTARCDGTQEGVRGRVSVFGGSGACSGSGILPWWPWRQCVSMAAGLLLAGLLALTQAWCVNAIHENLLWFSQLMVGVLIRIIEIVLMWTLN